MVIHLSNDDSNIKYAKVSIQGPLPPNPVAVATTIHPQNGDENAANSPGDPTNVSPKPASINLQSDDGVVLVKLQPRSFTTITLTSGNRR